MEDPYPESASVCRLRPAQPRRPDKAKIFDCSLAPAGIGGGALPAFMIAANDNAVALSSYMGHSTLTVTLDRYGHLLPGNEREAAALLDCWLAGAE